jgi:hypothetical protein
MSVDISNETVLGLAQAARRVPSGRRERPVHPSTLFRWIHDGVRVAGGAIIRLEALRLGGRWVTSLEALQRFAEALTPTLGPPDPTPRTPAACRRSNERAAAELDKLGV